MFKNVQNKDNFYCAQCKGSCIRSTHAEMQKAAKEKFGIIPNNCVPDYMTGKDRCPYR